LLLGRLLRSDCGHRWQNISLRQQANCNPHLTKLVRNLGIDDHGFATLLKLGDQTSYLAISIGLLVLLE
jgi:hypothetical protein